MNTRDRRVAIFILLIFLLFTVACGEEESQSNQGGENDTSQQNGDNQSNGQEECEEGQSRNPFTGDCVDDTDETNQNNGEQCPPGTTLDPVTGDCEPDETEPTCEAGEVFDADLGECVPDDSGPCGPGAVSGQACTPSGDTLAAAQVTITGLDCDGAPFTIVTSSDGAGNYTLENIPAGDHELLVSSGSFTGERTVRVEEGQTTDLSSEANKVCVLGDDVNIMVLEGFNESMTSLLDDMELDYDTISSSGATTANFLSEIADLLQYDILFFECNHTYSSTMNHAVDETLILNNLRTFVNSGGSLYAADNAYQWADETFPDLATFGSTAGSSEVVEAEVMSAEMFTLLGMDTVDIDFDLSGMRTIESVDPTATLHFRGTRAGSTNAPLMYSYNEPINNGTVIYTSFHSSAQGGAASDDILTILNFLIFQL